MNPADPHPRSPATSAITAPGEIPIFESTVGLACDELWGGNQLFHGSIQLPGIRGVLYSRPCEGASGGDVHYLSVCGSGLLSRICLADVTGHGERVAAVGREMHRLLRRSVNRVDERKVLRRLNIHLANMDERSFTTAAAMSYFAPTRRLSIGYAGHEPAYYYTAASGNWSRLELPHRRGYYDIALSAEPSTRYSRRVRKVAMGDRLLMFTDGVLEAPNRQRELFGHRRLEEVLSRHHDQKPARVVQAIVDGLSDHVSGGELTHDDVSILLIEFTDNLRSSALWTALRNRLFGKPGLTRVFKPDTAVTAQLGNTLSEPRR